MDILTKENIGLLLGIIGSIPVFKGGLLFLTYWNRKRKLAAIEKEILFITRIRDSDRALLLFLFRAGFIVAALMSVSIMLSAMAVDERELKLLLLLQFFAGTMSYFFSVYTIGYIVRIKNSVETLSKLQFQLEKLKEKIAPQV
ncbi:MAG: hypothetical protein ING25_09640 [Burkholderiales bacterium]|jgi:hypothetical protein|nr:hypothetical protein [Burkholderiales bacterium]MCA3173302.1 hypothetical protein [Burkholderiales bacterium]